MKGITFFVLGLILTMGGVGGVEHSLDNLTLLQSTLIAVCGLALMLVGTSYINDGANNTMRRLGSLPKV